MEKVDDPIIQLYPTVAFQEMLGKTASSILAMLPCSRTPCTLRTSKWLRPCWTDFFKHSLSLMMSGASWSCIYHGHKIFNSTFHAIPVLGFANSKEIGWIEKIDNSVFISYGRLSWEYEEPVSQHFFVGPSV